MNKNAIKRTIKSLSKLDNSKELIEKFKNQCLNDERMKLNAFFDECIQYVHVLRDDSIEARRT